MWTNSVLFWNRNRTGKRFVETLLGTLNQLSFEAMMTHDIDIHQHLHHVVSPTYSFCIIIFRQDTLILKFILKFYLNIWVIICFNQPLKHTIKCFYLLDSSDLNFEKGYAHVLKYVISFMYIHAPRLDQTWHFTTY